MSQVQVVVTEGQETQVAVLVPGIQGPAGISNIQSISTPTYTLTEVDRSKILVFTNSTSVTVTVSLGLSTLFDVMLVQSGTGQITVVPASGVTINAALSATKTAYRYATASLIPIASNTFILSGEVAA
jgi:hypothetical protein